jgi:hypothetical protein
MVTVPLRANDSIRTGSNIEDKYVLWYMFCLLNKGPSSSSDKASPAARFEPDAEAVEGDGPIDTRG